MFKTLLVMSMFIVVILIGAKTSVAETELMWSLGVEVPVRYISKVSTGKNGVLIKGEQSNVNKKGGIRNEIVKKGFWSDQSFDKIEVKNEGKFKVYLNAPSGNDYSIKISGYGSMAHGTFTISPY